MKRTPIRVLALSLLLILGILLSLTGCEPSYRQKRSPLAMRRTVSGVSVLFFVPQCGSTITRFAPDTRACMTSRIMLPISVIASTP